MRLTATGAILGTIKPSAPNGTITAVAAAGDDRTFVLDEQPWVTRASTHANQAFEPRTFYLLRLSASGRPGPLTRLPVTEPSGAFVTGFALSPDHTELAVAVQPDNVTGEPDLQEVNLYRLATGAVLRTWRADGTIGSAADDAESLSWTSDQRTLAFAWEGAPQQGEWLLDLGRGGTDLIGDSREAVATSCEPDLIIAPDGSAVVCGITDYSTADGKIVRTLADENDENMADVLWSNPSGGVLIVWTGGSVDIVTAGKFTPLPGPSPWREDEGAW